MVEITLPILLQIVQTLGILVGIVYYLIIMRNSQRNQELARKAQEQALETRQTQVFMRLYEQLNSEESGKTMMDLMYLDVEDNEEYLRKYDSHANIEHFAKRSNLWFNYNTVGELLRMGFINSDLIHRLGLDVQVVMMWEKWGHIIQETRLREKLPDLWEGFEYLYNEMKEYRRMKGYPDPVLTPKDYIS
jgi:hypothetical protein